MGQKSNLVALGNIFYTNYLLLQTSKHISHPFFFMVNMFSVLFPPSSRSTYAILVSVLYFPWFCPVYMHGYGAKWRFCADTRYSSLPPPSLPCPSQSSRCQLCVTVWMLIRGFRGERWLDPHRAEGLGWGPCGSPPSPISGQCLPLAAWPWSPGGRVTSVYVTYKHKIRHH